MQCDFLDYRGGILSGGYYCKKDDKYVDRYTVSTYCDNSLRYRDCPVYKESSSGGCYLTTVMCSILGHVDNCYVLNCLRSFRDNYMKKEEACTPLLEDYKTVGSIVSDCLYNDKNNKNIAKDILTNYIKPALTMIENGCYDDAIEIYKAMTLDLVDRYNIDRSLLSSEKVIGNSMQRKRELQTV